MRLRCILSLGALLLGSAPAGALPLVGLPPIGLDEGYACLAGASPCSPTTNAIFTLDGPEPAIGSLVLTGSLFDGAFITADLTVSVGAVSFSGAGSGVDQVEFTSAVYTAVSIPVLVLDNFAGGWDLLMAGDEASSSVTGFIEQLLVGSNVAGPTAFVRTGNLISFGCNVEQGTLVGVCGFSFGQPADFRFSIGGQNYDFVHTFNVIVPEPATLALLALGVAAVGAAQRLRSR